VATNNDADPDVAWCEDCTELMTVPEQGSPVHTATQVRACADDPHGRASVVWSTPKQRESVIRLRADYPEYLFTVEFGVFITAGIPGALTHISDTTEDAMRGRLDSDRSRRRWAARDAKRAGGMQS